MEVVGRGMDLQSRRNEAIVSSLSSEDEECSGDEEGVTAAEAAARACGDALEKSEGFALAAALRHAVDACVGERLHALCEHHVGEKDAVQRICDKVTCSEDFIALETEVIARSHHHRRREEEEQEEEEENLANGDESQEGNTFFPMESTDVGTNRPPKSSVAPREKATAPCSLVAGIIVDGAEGDASIVMHAWDDGVVLGNVLRDEECDALVAATERSGYYSFWHPDGRSGDASASNDGAGAIASEDANSFRACDTIEVTSDEIAAALWQRMCAEVPMTIDVDVDGRMHERGIEGRWVATGINPTLLFVRYGVQDHFSPHTDGHTVVDFNTRSFCSVLVYLNDNEDGGRTRFMRAETTSAAVRTFDGDGSGAADDDDANRFIRDSAGRFRFPESDVVSAAGVVRGSACIFKQDVPHEGEPVYTGFKYIIRTDIMYRRDPPIFDGEMDKEAFRLFQAADLLEADGKAAEAARKYRHACRLSPELARVFGL